jgi:ATP-binding cassette, subfamily B, bacterial CvaB/MchF/RaxB
VLFLDEGTAHLDIDTERRINQHLRGLDLTRISVAHRPEMISGADRLIRIDSNAVKEIERDGASTNPAPD